MQLSDFDYALPDELIAREPLPERDGSRLLRIPLDGSPFEHRTFRELPGLLCEGDLLVVNEARVIPARLRGRKALTGGEVEILLDRPLEDGRWLCLGNASKGFREGQRLELVGGLIGRVAELLGDGFLAIEFDRPPLEVAKSHGELPLPPYLGRPAAPADADRYQTVYARAEGAVAAPTAGLHFTPRIFEALEARGVAVGRLTLLVGSGTFLPIRAERIEDHRMHAERYEIPAELAEAVAQTRARGGRIVAVGTTALRALEAAADDAGGLRPGRGETSLFVRPGHRFRLVQGLLTNFHLPRSSLLVLVSAFAGRERILAAYAEATARRYRFFSYGDCTLLA